MNQTKVFKKVTSIMMVLVMTVALLAVAAPLNTQAANPKISKKKLTLEVGKSKKLKINNAAKDSKVTWSTNKKKIATVTKAGKVKAVKEGKATITAKYTAGKTTKTFKCKVTVEAAVVEEDPTVDEPTAEEPTEPVKPVESDDAEMPAGAIMWESFEDVEEGASSGTNFYKFGGDVAVVKASGSDEAKIGDKYVKVSNRKNPYDGVAFNIMDYVKAGGTYKFSAWVRNDSGTDKLNMTMKLETGGKEDYKPIVLSNELQQGVWTKIEGEYTIPAGTEKATPWIEIKDVADGGFSVDGFAVVPVTAATETPATETPGATAEKPEGAVMWEDFEGTTHQATPYDGSTLTLTKDGARSGDQYLKVTGRKTKYEGCGLIATDIVKKGSSYKVSVWVRNDTGAAVEGIQLCYRIDVGGKKDYVNMTAVDAKKGVWTLIEGETTIAADTSEVFFYIQTTSGELLDYSVDDYAIIAQ